MWQRGYGLPVPGTSNWELLRNIRILWVYPMEYLLQGADVRVSGQAHARTREWLSC